VHALRRMFERWITLDDVRAVLAQGETIEERPDELPYPSRLVLGYSGGRALHIVVADNKQDDETIIVTIYEPDPAQWLPGFKRRRSP
jgi:hypothetical protein